MAGSVADLAVGPDAERAYPTGGSAASADAVVQAGSDGSDGSARTVSMPPVDFGGIHVPTPAILSPLAGV